MQSAAVVPTTVCSKQELFVNVLLLYGAEPVLKSLSGRWYSFFPGLRIDAVRIYILFHLENL